MKIKISCEDGIVSVDTKELEKAIDTANILIDKIKEANALIAQLTSLADCLNLKVESGVKPEDF